MVLIRILGDGRLHFADLPPYLRPRAAELQRFVDGCKLRPTASYCLSVSEDEDFVQVMQMTPLKHKEL